MHFKKGDFEFSIELDFLMVSIILIIVVGILGLMFYAVSQ